MDFKYKPDGDVLRDFMRDDTFFRGIRGPVGSGKSVGCCVEIFRRALNQAPGQDGIARIRVAVIRSTYPQLKTTTIKTWLDWFPEKVFGKFNWSTPYTHNMKFGKVEIEVIFLALDRPEDVDKLLSLELTIAWINEAREVPKEIVDGATMRVGRFPSMREGGPTWYGVIADTNAPDDDHWWPIMAGETPVPDHIPAEEALMLQKPKDWAFYTQPPGMEEVKNAGGQVIGYNMSKRCENRQNLTPGYYSKIIQGKTRSWIDVYVLNKLGSLDSGKPVYPSYNDEVHVAQEGLQPFDNVPVIIGLDFGLTPAAVFCQRLSDGRWLILRELVAIDMGIKRFSQLLRAEIARNYPDHEIKIYGDPAGDQRAQTDETTPFQIMRGEGLVAYPAPSNDPIMRIEAVAGTLDRMVNGNPGMLIDPVNSKVLRKGFRGGYQMKRLNVAGEARYEERPNKNKYSHVHDACQYAFLGGGEGREVLGRKGDVQPAIAKREWNVWNHGKREQKRGNGGWSNRRRGGL